MQISICVNTSSEQALEVRLLDSEGNDLDQIGVDIEDGGALLTESPQELADRYFLPAIQTIQNRLKAEQAA